MKKATCIKMMVVLWVVCAFVAAAPLFADEEVTVMDDTDEEALFGGDEEGADLVMEIAEKDTAQGIENILLTSEEIRWSGKLSFALDSSWSWQNDEIDFPWLFDHFTEPAALIFSPELGVMLTFDARPDKDFRVLGKADITYPLDASPVELDDVFHIRELFADYNWDNRLFFRLGKHTIKWGVGYFYSPADILNITPIDPADPEAEREGPLSVKINFPIGLDNLYLYVVANNITDPAGIAFAPRFEWVIGDTEIGIGAFYRPDLAVRPRAMLTATFNLFDVDMYGEAVVSYGSERNFIRETTVPPGFEAVQDTETLFFDATFGFLYSYENDEQNLHLSLLGQYFYNGDGYTDPGFLNTNALAVAQLKAMQVVSDADLVEPAQHYGVITGSFREILGSDFSLSCSWIGASDNSGSINPAVSWVSGTRVSLTLNAPMAYGKTIYDYFTISPGISLLLYEKTMISLAIPLFFQENADNIPVWKTAGIALGFSLENGLF